MQCAGLVLACHVTGAARVIGSCLVMEILIVKACLPTLEVCLGVRLLEVANSC